jgi:hypothetical protein
MGGGTYTMVGRFEKAIGVIPSGSETIDIGAQKNTLRLLVSNSGNVCQNL